jgi:tagatose 1,6-diphosphate aldolase
LHPLLPNGVLSGFLGALKPAPAPRHLGGEFVFLRVFSAAPRLRGESFGCFYAALRLCGEPILCEIISFMKLPEGKLRRMKALSNDRGIIAAAAMDQRGSLQKSLAAARGVDVKEITPEMMGEFKTVVTKVLTPHASAILLDPEFGLDASRARAKNAGLLLAYELSGYDNTQPGRLPDLLPHVSVKRLVGWGADAVKILIYYSPHDDASINDVKHAFIERIGAECETYEIPFFLEFVGYDPKGGDEKGLEYAKAKPEIVRKSMEEFSKPQYKVDVLKVEVPINAEYVEGSGVYKGQKAYSRDEALKHFREAAAVAAKPFIYLSAGVSNAQFTESLKMASESAADYSGVLCGRATWKEGIPVYAKQGAKALEEWMQREGVKNINAVNGAIRSATAWYAKLGVAVPA